MINLSVNIIGVIVATIACFFLGFVWYGPLFGKQWMKIMGVTKKDMQKAKKERMTKQMIVALLTNFITVYIIAVLLTTLQVTAMAESLFVGVLIWGGFYFTKDVGPILWEKRPLNFLQINATYDLAVILVTVVILTLF